MLVGYFSEMQSSNFKITFYAVSAARFANYEFQTELDIFYVKQQL